MREITEVAAALIWEGDRFLICRRPPHKGNGLKWEFVGGKHEPGETGEQALKRECMEELAVEVEVGKSFFDTVHEYPDITVHITFYLTKIVKGEPQLLEHVDLRWITPDEIDGFDFCPADEGILRKIRKTK